MKEKYFLIREVAYKDGPKHLKIAKFFDLFVQDGCHLSLASSLNEFIACINKIPRSSHICLFGIDGIFDVDK